MAYTTDPNDPRLGHGVDAVKVPQHAVYLILSEEERAKGFVRPLRRAYLHVGPPGPQYPLRDLTEEEDRRYFDVGYVKFEEYPEGTSALGRFWTQAQLDAVNKGCGTETRMGLELCETYSRDPRFYGNTMCVGCSKHLAVNEFVWIEPDGSVGPRVGS